MGPIMALAQFNMDEVLSFFAVLVRLSVLFSIVPFFGDRLILAPIKVLLSIVVSITLFPVLVASGSIKVSDAHVWGATAGGLTSTIALEVMFGLALGFVSRLVFEALALGANLVGNFMGFASASVYDPHQESQTEVVAHIQTTLAMLLFLVIDGHHVLLRAILDSYKVVGIGKAGFNDVFQHQLIFMTAEVFRFGVQMASPTALGLFLLNMIFGVLSKSLPQLNLLVITFAANALVGFAILFISFLEFHDSIGGMFGRMNEWMRSIMIIMGKGG